MVGKREFTVQRVNSISPHLRGDLIPPIISPSAVL